MSRFLFAGSGCLTLVALLACGGGDQRADQGGTGEAGGGQAATADNDAEILAVLSTVNQGEIRSARMAKERSSSPVIDQYAQHMLDDHKKAESQVQAVHDPDPSPNELSQSLEDQASAEMAKLDRLSGAEFDRAYAESQAKIHREVLEAIDSMMPNAESPQVKSVLETVRPQVAAHLTHAQQLQSAGAPAGGGAH